MPIQEVVKRHPLTSTKVHHRAKNKQFSTLRCTKTGSTQPKLSAACFVVQSCLADADFVVFSNYCLIGTRPSRSFFFLQESLFIEVVVAEVVVLRGVVAQQAIESRERQIALAEERVRALELLELVGELLILDIAAECRSARSARGRRCGCRRSPRACRRRHR